MATPRKKKDITLYGVAMKRNLNGIKAEGWKPVRSQDPTANGFCHVLSEQAPRYTAPAKRVHLKVTLKADETQASRLTPVPGHDGTFVFWGVVRATAITVLEAEISWADKALIDAG